MSYLLSILPSNVSTSCTVFKTSFEHNFCAPPEDFSSPHNSFVTASLVKNTFIFSND